MFLLLISCTHVGLSLCLNTLDSGRCWSAVNKQHPSTHELCTKTKLFSNTCYNVSFCFYYLQSLKQAA